jgi:hypothetical protein
MRKYMHHHVHQHNINHWGGWPTNCHLKKGVNIIGLGPCPHKVVPCSATPASNKLGWSNKEIIGKNQQWTSDPIADFTWFNIFHPQPTTTSTLSSFSIRCCFSSSRSRSSVSMPSSFSWRLASAERLPAPSPQKNQTENVCFLSQFFEGAI